jgi:predicted ArsR family transcriptional regulator
MARNHKKRRKGKSASRHARRFNIQNYPDTPPPKLGTVRTWMRQMEDEGAIERKAVEHTGKPGRPAVLWGLTEDGRQRALALSGQSVPDMLTGRASDSAVLAVFAEARGER